MGDDTLKTKKSKKSVYDRLNAQLDVMDKSKAVNSADNLILNKVARTVRSFLGVKEDPKQQVLSGKHYSLLKKVEKLEARMIEEGNK